MEEEKEKETISLWKENGSWVIKHEESQVASDGETRMRAIFRLVDAMSDVSYYSDEPLVNELDEDPLRVAARVFVPSRSQEEDYREVKNEAHSEEQEGSPDGTPLE
jgi:hypothetical protein